MYFGSVSFFKQMIYSTAICSAAIMASFALMFGIKCSAESTGAVQASSSRKGSDLVDAGTLNVPEGTTLSQVYLAMAAKGYTDEDIINFIAETDSKYLDEYVRSKAAELERDGVDSSAPYYDPSYLEREALKGLYPDMFSDTLTEAFPSDGGTVYLAFTGVDGDIGGILDVLGAHGIKAVFFAAADADEEIIAEISRAGHTVGIYCQNSDEEKSTAEYIGEFYTAFTKVRKAAGYAPSLFCLEESGAYSDLVSEMTRRGFICCGNSVLISGGEWDSSFGSEISGALETMGHAVAGISPGGCSAEDTENIISAMEAEGFLISDPISGTPHADDPQ